MSTQAGELPLIPEWALPYTGTPGSGTAVLPAYIVTRGPDRVPLADGSESAGLQTGAAELADTQSVVVKFGGVVVKGATYAHYEVKVNR